MYSDGYATHPYRTALITSTSSFVTFGAHA